MRVINKYYKITPEGTNDILFEECIGYTEVSKRIKTVFESRFFNKVTTPGFEFYDLFANENAKIPQEYMFKSTDNKGRLLVARYDSTLPISRMSQSRLQNEVFPVRLYYKQPVYRNMSELKGKITEIMQMGIELLGTTGIRADLELISTAAETLEAVIPDYRIEIGHTGFFNALINQLNVSGSLKEEIRQNIENKNYSSLTEIYDSLEDKNMKAIKKLPRLFGGKEVFPLAYALCNTSEASEALQYLENLYKILCELGLSNKIIIDLGLVQKSDYYSGIVFKGYVTGCGDAIVSGGRYDKLMDTYESPMGAAGFAINLNELTKCFLQKNSFKLPVPDVLVWCAEGFESQGIKEVQRLKAQHKTAQFCILPDIESTKKYAEAIGVEEVYWIVGAKK